MKKILLTIGSLCFAVGAFAQGTIIFANVPLAGFVQTQSPPAAPANAPLNGYTVAIYWNPSGVAGAGVDPTSGAFASFVLGAQYVDNAVDFPAPGKFNGGNGTFAGLPGGQSGVFEVIGWTGNFANYAAAVAGNAFVGFGPQFANATGGGGSPASTPAPITGWNGSLLLLQPVPEPGTIALGGLGVAALLLFRRRK